MSNDAPGHVMEIPESLGRDIDRGLTPPVEAFMSPEALEYAESAAHAASGAVRAEDLRPISPAEAAARSTFDGSSLPRVSNRRVIPPPFRRDRIAVDHHGKTWQTVLADSVVAGDIVPDVGRVVSADLVQKYAPRREFMPPEKQLFLTDDELDEPVACALVIRLAGAGGLIREFRPDAGVRVFRSAP